MHYKKLIEAHKLFYRGEHRASNYDRYLEKKNWSLWRVPEVPIGEIAELFKFIKSWDRFFQGDEKKFKEIYAKIFPAIEELRSLNIEDADLTDREIASKIKDVFNKVARCAIMDRYESTDASKILHTIIPDFFVMWDDKIKDGLVQGRRMGATYAFYFLPIAQNEINETIETYMTEKGMSRIEAIKYIRNSCDGKTLAKLIDEYNYMKYTICHPSLQ